VSEPAPGWVPKLVALDIDGTLLRWVDGAGQTHAEVSEAVADAVRRAREAGAHVVLASGRSPHGMVPVADMLGLDDPADPVWVVASNGGVVFRVVALGQLPVKVWGVAKAIVGVEERGVGYRVNKPFPAGELSGDMIETPLEQIVAEPVSRVIIRDPEATADDFVELAGRLGLHGTDYVVGWTAWMDLSPVGVSKASGLQHVCDELGVDAQDVLAIGDGRNDLEMFAWAGRSVAMGQAIDEVRQAADDVTATVDEDGAAQELGRYF
jgi:hydroxymethylpyrimidine pyrophosphatase-like HAD family hydrolase